MSDLIFETTYNVNNKDLNFSGDISCKDVEHTGGKVATGFAFKKNINPKLKTLSVNTANCANLQLNAGIGNIKKGTILNDVCDCNIVSSDNGKLACPNNKFIKTYYPLLNKVSCCSPCTNNGEVKTEFNDSLCENIKINIASNTAICPKNKYVNSLDFKNNQIRCCLPTVGGNYGEHIQNISDQCQNMGIDDCTEDNINRYNNMCKQYGITDCTYSNIINTQSFCDKYGMRYMDIDLNTLKNPSSLLECHQNNVDDLDKFCKEKNITPCNWTNIQEWKDGNMNQFVNLFTNKLNRINYLSSFLFSILCILIILFILYIRQK